MIFSVAYGVVAVKEFATSSVAREGCEMPWPAAYIVLISLKQREFSSRNLSPALMIRLCHISAISMFSSLQVKKRRIVSRDSSKVSHMSDQVRVAATTRKYSKNCENTHCRNKCDASIT